MIRTSFLGLLILMNFHNNFPFYIQYDAMDCGPACLRMIAKYYGKSCSLQYLRDKSYVTRAGVSLQGLREAAETIGMKAKCVLASFDYLVEEAKVPCIVHWDRNHFVVVYKISSQWIYVADPAFGKTRYRYDEFLARWAVDADSGYVLLAEPGEKFVAMQAAEQGQRQFWTIFSYLKSYKQLVLQLLLALLIGSCIQLVLPFLTQLIVDKGIAASDIGLLQLILLGQFFVIASRTTVNFIRGWILFYISTPVYVTLVYDFLIKITKLPLRYFDSKMIGDTLQRITDYQRIEIFLTSTALSVLLTVVNFVVFGAVLSTYSTDIFLIFLAGTALYVFWIRLFLARRRELDHSRFQHMGKSHNAIIQLIMGMPEIRLNNCERKKIGDWIDSQHDLFLISKGSLALSQKQQAGYFLLQETQTILITYLAASAVITGDMTLGMMLAVQFILGQLHGPVEQLIQFTAAAQDAKTSFERIEEINSLDNEENSAETKLDTIPEAADIVISKLSFQYGGPYSEQVLKDISLILPHNKTTAIVGTSGSGKTTLMKLLLGAYRPTDGEIAIGPYPLENIARSAWRKQCGAVMQDGYIFPDTIANNIALQDKDADLDKVKQAAAIANIDEFITSLPLAYNTVIGANGHGLSQGQKQRILIARAVYKNPHYIFFDEATNALDTYNEQRIMENLEHFFRDRTVVIIAHRLSTVKNADQIVVLDKGVIIEQGTHHELISRKGQYYHLVKNQLELGR